MIELYLSKVTESSETEMAGKMYARVSYKQTMDLHDMAHHMAEHNTAFSEGLIVGVLTDFVKCVREMVLNGNTVKVGNLRCPERQGGFGYYRHPEGGRQDRRCREDHQVAGTIDGRLHPRGAEEGREVQLDRQDQG